MSSVPSRFRPSTIHLFQKGGILSECYQLAPTSPADWFNKCLCDNACKRSLAICRKSMHCVPLAGLCLSLYNLHVLKRDVNMIQQTNKSIHSDLIISMSFLTLLYIDKQDTKTPYRGSPSQHNLRHASLNMQYRCSNKFNWPLLTLCYYYLDNVQSPQIWKQNQNFRLIISGRVSYTFMKFIYALRQFIRRFSFRCKYIKDIIFWVWNVQANYK